MKTKRLVVASRMQSKVVVEWGNSESQEWDFGYLGRTEAAVRKYKWCNVRCFTATYKNKKFQRGAFLLSTLALHLTKLSKVTQAGCFDFAQVKASVELCINEDSDAAAKSELKANCEKRHREFGMLGGLAHSCVSSGMTFWKGAKRLANWSSPHKKMETGVAWTNYQGIFLLNLQGRVYVKVPKKYSKPRLIRIFDKTG